MSLTDPPKLPTRSTPGAAPATSPGASSVPSPSTANTTTVTPTSNAKRASRKSTLTQQQKNNKRQRATQDQLVTLELEFNKNPTPTGATRERIAQQINMTERSVQIWFQNRRAKIKMLAKKSIETGESCDAIPESMRRYLAFQFDPSKPGAREIFCQPVAGGSNGLHPIDAASSGKVVIHHLTCRSLTIGNWRRVGQNAMDLVVFYSPEKACMTYYINNDSAGYKIEYPFSYIKNITLDSGEHGSQQNGAPPRPSGLVVELNRPPFFYMDSSNSGGFYQCGDFTEDQQASQILVHHLGGHPKVLSVQLAKLVALESFRNRMTYSHLVMPSTMSPPFIPRPASQPSQYAVPFVGAYMDAHLSAHAQAARGHKRQRSRSVPVAVDFSSMHPPPPVPFHIPQPHAQFNVDSRIYAPVAQSVLESAPTLRIDTSAEYGMDVRANPMSATTTASPSEFASPSMFSIPMAGESTQVPNMTTSFSLPFISTAMEPSSTTATSAYVISPTDPMIADHSPPLSTINSSSDLFTHGFDPHFSMSEEGLMLNATYSKPNMSFSQDLASDSVTFDLPIHGFTGRSPTAGSDDMDSFELSQGLPLPSGS